MIVTEIFFLRQVQNHGFRIRSREEERLQVGPSLCVPVNDFTHFHDTRTTVTTGYVSRDDPFT